MDNILWEIATGILAYVARMKAKLGIQPKGAKLMFWLCILTMIAILINENVAYVLSISAILLGFLLGYVEREYLKKQKEIEKSMDK